MGARGLAQGPNSDITLAVRGLEPATFKSRAEQPNLLSQCQVTSETRTFRRSKQGERENTETLAGVTLPRSSGLVGGGEMEKQRQLIRADGAYSTLCRGEAARCDAGDAIRTQKLRM